MATCTLNDGTQITYTTLTIESGGPPGVPPQPHAKLTAAQVPTTATTGALINIGAAGQTSATYAQYADPVTATIAHVPLNRIRSAL